MSKKTNYNKNKNSGNKSRAIIAGVVVAVFVIVAILAFVLFPSEDKKKDTKKDKSSSQNKTESAEDLEVWDGEGEELMSGKVTAQIEIEEYGTITVELDADIAPISVTNFVNLAKDGFYDGLTFHRIISGFMIQGGDPLGNGTGGSDRNIKGEFANNGVDNPLSHTRGAISMARSMMPDSASSQFFICHQDAPHLDGDYACFGYVTEGIEIVDAICEAVTPVDGNGTILADDQPVIKTIKIL